MARKAQDQLQQIEDKNKGKYFHIMLNMADDDLTPYEYRLLGHYIRVGECWEGVRTTAKTCKMSVGMVVKTRKSLEKNGYIKAEHRDKDTVLITVIDRMSENVARYAGCSPHEQGVHHMNTNRSPHEQGVHTVNERITIEEEHSKKNKEEDTHSPNGGRVLSAFNEIVGVIGKVYGYGDKAALTHSLSSVLAGCSKKKGWKEYNVEPPMTVEEVTTFYKEYNGNIKPQKPITLQAEVYKWRARRARAVPSIPAPYEGDDAITIPDDLFETLLKKG